MATHAHALLFIILSATFKVACSIQCQTKCVGSKCVSGIIEPSTCGAECSSDNCSTGCFGKDCKAKCTGEGCESGCTGESCKSTCQGDDCRAWCSGNDCKVSCDGQNCETNKESKKESSSDESWSSVRRSNRGHQDKSLIAGHYNPERSIIDESEDTDHSIRKANYYGRRLNTFISL